MHSSRNLRIVGIAQIAIDLGGNDGRITYDQHVQLRTTQTQTGYDGRAKSYVPS